jgi:hypothetical protein
MDTEEKSFREICPNHKYMPSILKSRDKIVVLGDLHGDYALTIRCLRIGKIINKHNKWIGGDTIVVQLGDQIDRCRPDFNRCDTKQATINDEASDIKILELFTNLHNEAQNNGGAVYSLLGNHELMNVEGNFNYVSYEGLKQFDTKISIANSSNENVRRWKTNRYNAFGIGEKYANMMACTRHSAIIIGDFLFVHAGIIPELVDKLKIKSPEDIKDINNLVRKWLLGLIDKEHVSDIVGSMNYSMFWNRILGNLPYNLNNNDPRCVQYLDPVLEIFKVGNMIVGHTPQFIPNQKGINATCGNSLWRADFGGSAAFSNYDNKFLTQGKVTDMRKAQVMIIENNKDVRIVVEED